MQKLTLKLGDRLHVGDIQIELIDTRGGVPEVLLGIEAGRTRVYRERSLASIFNKNEYGGSE